MYNKDLHERYRIGILIYILLQWERGGRARPRKIPHSCSGRLRDLDIRYIRPVTRAVRLDSEFMHSNISPFLIAPPLHDIHGDPKERWLGSMRTLNNSNIFYPFRKKKKTENSTPGIRRSTSNY